MKISMDWGKEYKYFSLLIETNLPCIYNLLSETSTILGESDKDYVELQWTKKTNKSRNKVVEFLSSYNPNKLGYSRCIIKINSRYRASRKRRISIDAIIKGIYYCDVEFGQRILDKNVRWDTKYGQPKEPEKFVRELSKKILETNLCKVSRPHAAISLWYFGIKKIGK